MKIILFSSNSIYSELLTFILPMCHMMFLIPHRYALVAGPAMLVNMHCLLIASQYYITSLNNINNYEWLIKFIEINNIYISLLFNSLWFNE